MTNTKDDTGHGSMDKGLGNKEMESDRKGDGTIVGTKGGAIKSTRDDTMEGNKVKDCKH